MKALPYPVAEDEHGHIVAAEEATKGASYRCPYCKGEFIIREGPKRRKHFAHRSDQQNCSPETVIHAAAKQELAEALSSAIQERAPYWASWECESCGRRYSLNIVDGIASVHLEREFESSRPDLTLLDDKSVPIWVIEIVVTHKPEEETLKLYRATMQVLSVTLSEKNFGEFSERVRSEISCEPVANIGCLTPKCDRSDAPILHESASGGHR